MAGCMQHFTNCLQKFMNHSDKPYSWDSELESFVGEMNKAVTGHRDSIAGSGMSYKDFSTALPEALKLLPAVITPTAMVEK